MALVDGVAEAEAAPVAAGTLVAEDDDTPTTAAALCVGVRAAVVMDTTPPAATPPPPRASVTAVPATAVVEDVEEEGEPTTATPEADPLIADDDSDASVPMEAVGTTCVMVVVTNPPAPANPGLACKM